MRPAGFTATELMLVLLLIGILATLLLAFRTSALKRKAQNVCCLNNLKQMMGAVSAYTFDNQDLFPPNPDDGNTRPGYNWCPGRAGIGDPQEFDSSILVDPRRCLVAPYLQSNSAPFHCSVDGRKGSYKGAIVPAARTLSMNAAVGTIDPAFERGEAGHSGKPKLATNAPWLAQAHANRRNKPWCTYARTTDIIAPSPPNCSS
jgi:prepilin-type N-terminal cleavage/methylation domain-containing protein